MLIECRARRRARDIRVGRRDNDVGTKADVYGQIYHFRPQPELIPDGLDAAMHVCEVSDDRAIERFVVGLPEEFNEVGKPPRVTRAAAQTTSGQPAVVTDMIDGDELGEPDAPQEVDPMAKAKDLHQKWLDDMLSRPVKQIHLELHKFNSAELGELRDEEARTKNRVTLVATLEGAIEEANEREEGGPMLPADDPTDISVE